VVNSPLTDEEQRVNEDYEWCLHDPEVRRLYGGQVVVAHNRRIWGAGRDHLAAYQAALRDPACPPRWSLAFVVVPDPPFDPTAFSEADVETDEA
jgi:hypothetical protein